MAGDVKKISFVHMVEGCMHFWCSVRYRLSAGRSVLRHDNSLYTEKAFRSMLVLERKRTERTKRPFLLVRIPVYKVCCAGVIDALARSIGNATRETDFTGWLFGGREIGVVVTDVENDAALSVTGKIRSHIAAVLPPDKAEKIAVTSMAFPGAAGTGRDLMEVLYDGNCGSLTGSLPYIAKRGIDIVGSSIGIALFLPFFLVIPILIKICSKGPVLYTQKRIGRYGRLFPCIKFRTMKVSNDCSLHREFVEKYISGSLPASTGTAGPAEYKIKNDPRVTGIGRLLRKTSLDELPQFINVLLGHMSLVGPRPAIPYEVEKYDLWHRRRVLEVKPGITGIWQIEGRSRTDFNSMVRMDIKYINTWSPILDLRLIVNTPIALVSAKGAC